MSSQIPDGFELARTTPTFDNETVPAGLLSAHRVGDGIRGVSSSTAARSDPCSRTTTTRTTPSWPGPLHHPARPAPPCRTRPTSPVCRDDVEPTINDNRHGFVGHPTDHVCGIVDDPANDVPEIMGDVLALNVASDAIYVDCCRQGREEFSRSAKGYGLTARVQRILQTAIGCEGERRRRVEREPTDGHAVVGVAVDDHDAKMAVAVAAVLAAAVHKPGVHDIHDSARCTIEGL